mmetsp:Transcript_7359/g.10741  ORF Transcript_7359/g.10741 Transcript_7359/m.10741 type:complete len:290 (+) Transcript_7359:80-949(+)|eukprot:CAMPEP_0194204610 /NCGR_PEP_ID=MMETSP0156-20130528/4087_1 /TAXON_ID=33649 /ORGANISM="Thalassionema nitzschioides, Strain L26-B" /LENGTH=289 /DNA_ID=CAMNT_0038930667 /DNA_START=72 /DNA_END=941 /DNA_ORIENTATION=-
MNRQRQVALPDPADVGGMVLRGAANFARRNKIITGSYVFGLLVILLAGTGTRLTLQQRQEYNSLMDTIDLQAEFEASQRYAMANQAYRASAGWFTCDSLCTRNKQRMELAKNDLDAIRREGHARMSDAKAVAGLFSEVGVGEVKDKFWSHFHSGQQFAKRQSMWDAMFIGIRSMSRDENMLEYALRVLMQILVNFSMGLIVAFFVFVFGLWGVVRDYQANPLVAVTFFLTASCAAFAFVATYLMGLFGAAGGGLYGLAKVAESSQQNARLNQGQHYQQRRYMGNRPHYQ